MDAKGQWKLSPAYDLTFSSGPRGEQSTLVMGEGKKPSVEHLVKLGYEARLSKTRINQIIDQTQSALAKWETLAKKHGVSANNILLIGKHINLN
jgi:serine/threonine-protein kinase HipA